MDNAMVVRIVFISILVIGVGHLLIKNWLHESVRTSNKVNMKINGNNVAEGFRDGYCGLESEKDDYINFLMSNFNGVAAEKVGPKPSNYYPGQSMNDALFCSDNTDLSKYFNDLPRNEFACKQKQVIDMPVDCRNGIPAVMDGSGANTYNGVNLAMYNNRQESVINGSQFFGDVTGFDEAASNYASFKL